MKEIDLDSALQLEAFDDETWQQIAARSTCYTCSAGERLNEQGSVDNRLIYVLSGSVSLNRHVQGVDQRYGVLKRRGETLSIGSLHIKAPKAFSSVVDENDTILLAMPYDEVFSLCETNPAFMHSMFRDLSTEFMRTLEYVFQEREMTPDSRVAYRLCEIQKSQGEIRLTHAELAIVVGASRATVSKVLTQLERAGIIARKYGRIVVTDLDKLCDWVDQRAESPHSAVSR